MIDAPSEDIAWAAGLFEGEGCFSGDGKHIMVNLAMCDRDVVERFQAVVGMGKVTPKTRTKSKPHWKPQWQWYVNSYDQLEVIAEAFWPYLGARRREKVNLIRSRRAAFLARVLTERECPECGTSFVPETAKRAVNRLYCSPLCRGRAANRKFSQKRKARACPAS